MRVNLYNEEITGEIDFVTKKAHDTGLTFYGVRVFLASPDVLHGPESGDDDRSAVTFWIGDARKARRLEGLLRSGLIDFAADNEPYSTVPDPAQPGIGG